MPRGNPDSVKRLAAEAEARKAAKKKPKPVVAKELRLRKPSEPKSKTAPTRVLTLIAQALRRKGQ